jgi:hypothetical protein
MNVNFDDIEVVNIDIGGGAIYLPHTAVIMFRTTNGATARAKITADDSNNLFLNSDNGGNVSIGTTSPNNTLTVNACGANKGIDLTINNTTTVARFGVTDPNVNNNPYIGGFSNNNFLFYSNSNVRLTLANTGEACFACQVCALSLTTSNVVRSGDSALLRGSNVSQVGNNITFDAFRFLNPTGGVGGAASSLNGILYMSFSDTFTGGNQVSYQYLIITTGNGVSPGPFCFAQLYCGPLRGTNPISSISLVNDGGGGAVKVQATTAASGVSGANAYISFVGTAV